MNALRRVRCPHCQTVFRVDPAKLERSRGWARCGHCLEPFDTARHALDAAAEPAQRLDFDRLLHTPAPPAPETNAATLPELDQPTVFSPAWEAIASGDRQQSERTPATSSAAAPANEPHRETDREQAPSFPAEPLLSEPPLVPTTFPFERQPPGPSPFALLAVLLLLLAALAQVAYLWRQEWIQRFPQTFSYWEQICQELGCTVSPPVDLQQLVLEHSELIREPAPGRWTLTFALRNRAAYPLPWPTLELTLSDAIGRTLLRRPIPPQEWGATGPYFPPGERVERTLALETFEAGIVGYELRPIAP
ncbi:DUF3426 domain-containing protein [Tepidiphilus sp. HLB4]